MIKGQKISYEQKLTWRRRIKKFSTKISLGSVCRAVGRAVASDARDSRFELTIGLNLSVPKWPNIEKRI